MTQLHDVPIRWLEETGSTNEDARQLALAGEQGPLWIAARRQSAGRGRQGRQWVSPEGNLYASLLWRPDGGMARFGGLSFVAALAVLRLAESLLPTKRHAGLALKWPNDVLLEEKKIAGILLEAEQDGRLGDWLVLGIGVNLASAPENTPFPAASLGLDAPDPKTALPILAQHFAELAALWQTGAGQEKIHQLWLARAWRVGEAIQVRLPERTLNGRFGGLESNGALKLITEHGIEYIHAGDVFFPASSGATE